MIAYQIELGTIHDSSDYYALMFKFYGREEYRKINELFPTLSTSKDGRNFLFAKHDRSVFIEEELTLFRQLNDDYYQTHRVGLIGYSVYKVYLPDHLVSSLTEPS